MKKHQITAWMFMTSMILLTGFKNQNIPSEKSAEIISHDELPKISIADFITAKGDKGQKAIEVVILLSSKSPNPVTVNYSTKNGTAKAGVDYVATSGTVS